MASSYMKFKHQKVMPTLTLELSTPDRNLVVATPARILVEENGMSPK